MKKLGLALFSCIALVAFMGMSGSAFAMTIDPSCDLDNPAAGDGIPGPYNNDPAIHDFEIRTPAGDSRKAGDVAGIGGSGVVCGSVATFTGRGTLYNSANIRVIANGVAVNPTSTMTPGSFSGYAKFNLASTLAGVIQNLTFELRVRPITECQDVAATVVGGAVPGEIIACHKAADLTGVFNNYNWYTDTDRDPGHQSLVLTIGPARQLIGGAGPTHIKQFNFCARAGAVGGSVYPDDCGDSTKPWLQRNGKGGCQGGNGIYTAKATQWGGLVTAEVSTCAAWTSVAPSPSNLQGSAPPAPKDKIPPQP